MGRPRAMEPTILDIPYHRCIKGGGMLRLRWYDKVKSCSYSPSLEHPSRGQRRQTREEAMQKLLDVKRQWMNEWSTS